MAPFQFEYKIEYFESVAFHAQWLKLTFSGGGGGGDGEAL
jgi:hypothetical protein